MSRTFSTNFGQLKIAQLRSENKWTLVHVMRGQQNKLIQAKDRCIYHGKTQKKTVAPCFDITK